MLMLPRLELRQALRPPVVVFSLIAAQLLLFVVIQQSDDRLLHNSSHHYLKMQFLSVEAPRYRNYLDDKGHTRALAQFERASAEQQSRQILLDTRFYRQLRSNAQQLVDQLAAAEVPDHALIDRWLRHRSTLQNNLQQLSSQRWGVSNQQFDIGRLASYGLVHNSATILAVNLMLLLACGPSLERRLGRRRFTGLYLGLQLAAGAAVQLLFFIDEQFLIGSSATIFGLLCFYALLMGRQKVDMLCWLLVSQYRVSIYAYSLAVAALCWLAITVALGHTSPTLLAALTATGAGAALAHWLLGPLLASSNSQHHAAPPAIYPQQLNQLYHHLDMGEFKRASRLLETLKHQHGDNFELCQLRYRLNVLMGQDYTASAIALLSQRPASNRQRQVAAELWQSEPALRQLLPADKLWQLAFEFNTPKLLAQAEDIFHRLRERHYAAPALAALAKWLSGQYGERGNNKKKRAYQRLADALLAVEV